VRALRVLGSRARVWWAGRLFRVARWLRLSGEAILTREERRHGFGPAGWCWRVPNTPKAQNWRLGEKPRRAAPSHKQ
jgi:hypothetical protein